MATEYIGLPGQLLEKVKAAAAREGITPEEQVRDTVEVRLSRAEWAKPLHPEIAMRVSVVSSPKK